MKSATALDPGCPHLSRAKRQKVREQWLSMKCVEKRSDGYFCGNLDACIECELVLCGCKSRSHFSCYGHHSLRDCNGCLNQFNTSKYAEAIASRCKQKQIKTLQNNHNETWRTYSGILDNTDPSQFRSNGNDSERHVEGLPNNGSTCYFNSAMQALMWTYALKFYVEGFWKRSFKIQKGDESITIDKVTSDSVLNKAFLEFSTAYISGNRYQIQTRLKQLTDLVGQKIHMSMYQQQDSHELIRRLFDELRAEESRVVQRSFMNYYTLKIGGEQADMVGEFHRLKDHLSFDYLDALFGGKLKQCLQCCRCGEVETRDENFVDLSLSLTNDRQNETPRREHPSTDVVEYAQEVLEGPYDNNTHSSRWTWIERDVILKKNLYDDYGFDVSDSPTEYSALRHSALRLPNTPVRITSISMHSAAHKCGLHVDEYLIEIGGQKVSDEKHVKSKMKSVCSTKVKLRVGRWQCVTAAENLTNRGDGTLSSPHQATAGGKRRKNRKAKKNYSKKKNKGSNVVSPETVEEGSNAHREPSSDLANLPKRLVDPGNVNIGDRPRKLEELLALFFSVEHLDGDSSYECARCFDPDRKDKQKYRPHPSWKQGLIREPPAVLMLHLKRFKQTKNRFGFNSDDTVSKIPDHVSFPPKIDIGPYCTDDVKRVAVGNDFLFYSLYAVISHSGSLNGGHYVAYVKKTKGNKEHDKLASVFFQLGMANSNDATEQQRLAEIQGVESKDDGDQWYYISDSWVQPVSETRVFECEAYVLFYERFC